MKGKFYCCAIILMMVLVSYPARAGVIFEVGYGRLHVSNIFVTQTPDVTNPPEAFQGKDWNTLMFSVGGERKSIGTGITIDFLFSEDKTLDSDLGSRPLVGGGYTQVSSSISHVGVYLGMRQRIWRVVASGGYGALLQNVDFHYDPPVSNGSGGFSESVPSWYLGLDICVTRRVSLGARRYFFKTDELRSPSKIDIGLTVVDFAWRF